MYIPTSFHFIKKLKQALLSTAFFSILPVCILLACESNSPVDTPLPTLSIADVQITEGDVNSQLKVMVSLSAESSDPVRVDYSTVDGTAEAETDFQKIENNTLEFSPGEVEKEISVEIIADEFKEDLETFQIFLSNPVNAEIVRARGTITLVNDDEKVDPKTLNIPETGFTSTENYSDMTLVWQDEFKASEISDDWSFENGDGCDRGICGWGNNELQYYRQENAFIANNEYLVIQARAENFGGKQYTSTRMITKGKQEFQYGRIDIRAAMPTGQGIWPALWMLGANIDQVGWPACGEIDIMEIVGHEPDKVHGTAHWATGSGQNASYGQSTDSPNSTENEFHVYSIIWDETQIQWLLDDKVYNIINTQPGDLSEFQEEFFFIFNIAVGGNWPGNPDATTVFPQRMVVDYIRVFQK